MGDDRQTAEDAVEEFFVSHREQFAPLIDDDDGPCEEHELKGAYGMTVLGGGMTQRPLTSMVERCPRCPYGGCVECDAG